jgi:predicted outer membrane protein
MELNVKRARWTPAALVIIIGVISQMMLFSSRAADHPGKLSASDYKFAVNAAEGGMLEVKLGQLAVERSTDTAVKQFGQRMIDDHGKAGK